MRRRILRFLERAVTPRDYFHTPHPAELAWDDPLRSYHYDLRRKADYGGRFLGPLPLSVYAGTEYLNPVHVSQFGLGHLQLYLDGGDESHLDTARAVADALIDAGTEEAGGIVWRYPIPHRGAVSWLSAMAQGQAASPLLRTGSLVGSARHLEAARAALVPFERDIESGGVRAYLRGAVWFEEYAVHPPAYTLNGFIVALLGLYDAYRLAPDGASRYRRMFEDGTATLKARLAAFDAAGWSRYDLAYKAVGPARFRNLASPFYHRFHLELLQVMHGLTGEPTFLTYHEAWGRALDEGWVLARGVAEKVAYRALSRAEVRVPAPADGGTAGSADQRST